MWKSTSYSFVRGYIRCAAKDVGMMLVIRAFSPCGRGAPLHTGVSASSWRSGSYLGMQIGNCTAIVRMQRARKIET